MSLDVSTPQGLAAQLRLMINDDDFIMRAVRLKFPDYGSQKAMAKPKPIPLVLPVVPAYEKEYVSKEDPATTADGPDKFYEKDMATGSKMLLEAITARKGPNAFMWSSANRASAWEPDPNSGNTANMLHRVSLIHEREARTDKLRVWRDPCFKCGARADVGCKHQRVA